MTDLIHPGRYVRDNVIPARVKVTEAAKLIGVGRPALSNFLNGNSDLSRDMAARLETAFGVPARKLLDIQSAWDAAKPKGGLTPLVKAYVPPFLQIKAAQIEAWGGTGILPRQRLSVLLRVLVNSTGPNLATVDFPGNDDSEREGWDGEILAKQGTPWIPEGHSGWEFGVNKNIKGKADGDFAKSVSALDEDVRKTMTFVFATPRSWAGKVDWVKAHRAKKFWKDVRAYDASDLEQWLEQSLVGQTWFANETGQSAHGLVSLDEAAKIWAADCDPPLAPALFSDAVTAFRPTLLRTLNTEPYKPAIITADSKDEALAFLSAAFASDDEELAVYRDRMMIFREAGALSKLAADVSNFIPVILSREVEKEFAPFRASMPSFIVYPRSATNEEPDIILETLSWECFDKALEGVGLKRDRIDQLSRESGRSPTVLRRRLSRVPAIRTPDWAIDQNTASRLIPFALAGAWNAQASADQTILEFLGGEASFNDLERCLAELLPLDSAPVWSVGTYRGVVSKVDVLFAIKSRITLADLRQFFEVAELVLAEDDPALDLPEKDQWAAAIYNKRREISGALRDGLAETLVLLSVFSEGLFTERLDFNGAARASQLVKALLTPLTNRTIESQVDNLPLYSEAAPDAFLSIIEDDLLSDDSVTLKLMRPKGNFPFGRAPRTGLLWALENLAWIDTLFMRTVLVLGRLAERVIDDNLVNKPSNSLSSIFRSWMPQTSVGLDNRKAALKKLAETYPAVAWPICIEQFSPHAGVGLHSHKPRWRSEGHGKGEPTTVGENNVFTLFAFALALSWPTHTADTVNDLIGNLGGVDEALHGQVWDVVDRWIGTAGDIDKANVREQLRRCTFTRRAITGWGKRGVASSRARATACFDRIEPRDLVLRHGWLFRQAWVEESAAELSEDDFDFEKHDERIAEARTHAVRDVLASGGVQAVLRLAEMGHAAHYVGGALTGVVESDEALVASLVELMKSDEIVGARADLLSGALMKKAESGDAVLRAVASSLHDEKLSALLMQAPFTRATWKLADEQGAIIAKDYWLRVLPRWNQDMADIRFAVERLIGARRPRAAFAFVNFELKHLPARQIYSLLVAILTGSDEPTGTYMLDQYRLHDAFKRLNASGEITTDEMAALEFQFIEIFDHSDVKPTNLARGMVKQPELFVQAVAFMYKRSDAVVDPPELQVNESEIRSNRAAHAYKLLNNIEVPFGSNEGFHDAEGIIKWVEQVRASLKGLARLDVGDQMIGTLLSKAPVAEDGVWPCLSVRDALEHVVNKQIDIGVHTALRNARGAHWRGEGGSQERELASTYRRWAEAMAYTHPRVATILRRVEESYKDDATWQDNNAKISRRMRY